MTTTIRAALMVGALLPAAAMAAEPSRPSFEIYGFGMVDYIQDFSRMPTDWDATLRPSKIPVGSTLSDGQAILSARQSRLGVRGSVPAGGMDLGGRVEFDFFGRGTGQPDSAGQNTIRLRRAYGEWGPILGGLTDSLFMDDDYWPNIIDYWGPAGMVFYRNVQIRFTHLAGVHSFAFALERPGSDLQAYPESLPDLASDNKVPDLTARYRLTQRWGYVQLSGILRRLGYENNGSVNNAHGSVVGWGLNASSTLRVLPDKLNLLLAVAGGQGVENYWNDATPDVAAGGTLANPRAEAVPVLGISAYADIYWNTLFTSSVGYSTTRIGNTSLQPGTAFEIGHYASANLLVHPVKGFLAGPEFLWGQRKNNDGTSGNDYRLQVSFKYAFSSKDVWK
ncbi:MAG TPA: DcaP family trimeric outer membrane transporter [Myxococcales bacterium]|nr:DcaP family trimeric outer membrane transporter [Myxococcales bacterium]